MIYAQQEYILVLKEAGSKKQFRRASWKYWEILEELMFRGIEYQKAQAAAKWATSAKPGDIYQLNKYLTMTVKGKTFNG